MTCVAIKRMNHPSAVISSVESKASNQIESNIESNGGRISFVFKIVRMLEYK